MTNVHRHFILGVVMLAVAACSSANSPTGTKKTTTTTTFDTLLSNGSIPPSGGTLTINKPGDPLNGLTMTVSSGAFSGALNVTIGSSSNKNLPTADGIIPISPVVHVSPSAGGYAHGVITFKVPATVPTNTFPVVVLYDSATNTIEPMTTIAYDGSSVTAITGHLSQPGVLSASVAAARVAGRSRPMGVSAASGAQSDSLFVAFGVYAIPFTVLNQDWDTHFRPGINDWEMPAQPTEAAPGGILLGLAATEAWYFNSGASSTPLNGRFPAIRNAPLSDTIGYHWVSLINNQVDQQVNSYLISVYKTLNTTSAGRDSLQFDQIRASFAIPTLNAGKPLPVLVDLQSSAGNGYYYLIAYRATGNQIYVADPISTGDSTLFLQLESSGMTPYVNAAYKPGISFTTPLGTPLGLAVPLAPLASSYPNAVAGSAGASLFPTSGFYSWSGQLYDTMYVVDSLRFWAQCATCQYGFATTLSPAPAGNVESSYQIYLLSGGLVTDSIGGLGVNGVLLLTNAVPPGGQRTLGVPLASAAAANAAKAVGSPSRWLDWQQITITNLQVTIAPNAPQALLNAPQALQVSVSPNLLPANVAYQWSFGDSTANVTVQNNPSVQHTYAKTGNFVAAVKIIDNRNAQVIGQANATVTVNVQAEVWSVTSLTYLYTTVNGVQGQSGVNGVPIDTLVLAVNLGTYPTLVALNGPPFSANYSETGFAFVKPTTGPQDWAKFSPDPLAISAPAGPYTIVGYTNTGTDTSGTITGQAIASQADTATNEGRTVNVTKNGSTLSGYINFTATFPLNGVMSTLVVVDSVVAVRVP